MDNLMRTYNNQCVRLGLESSPPILLVGEDAINFISNHYSNRDMKFSVKKTNAMFLYENLDEDYIEANNIDPSCLQNGIICLVKKREFSLVHEMRHAYQLKQGEDYMFLEENEGLKREYTQTYPYYLSEQDAFTYTIDFLRNEVLSNISDNKVRFNLESQLSIFRYFSYKLNYIGLKMEYYIRYKRYRLGS